jgi:hypothetical protein
VGGELRGSGSGAFELLRDPPVQLLALAGKDRRVDRLREQGVPEAEGPSLRIGYEDVVLDRLAQPVAHVRLGQPGRCADQRVSDVASCRCGDPQQALRRRVEAGGAHEQQVADAEWELGALTGRREELLGEERVALRTGRDHVRHSRPQGLTRASCEQLHELLALEWSKPEDDRRAGSPDAVSQTAHSLAR